jgi:uncharacterized protein YndB with AHSA1/START domain
MPGWDGVVHCEVIEARPPERLVYTWRGGGDAPAMRLDTRVTWTLAAAAGGTRLRLEHSGFTAANAFAFDTMGKGWRGKLADRIRQVLEQAA